MVRVADNAPPDVVHARVRGNGARRWLTWNATGLTGERLTLVERGRGGDNAQRLVATARAHGRLSFTPSPLVPGNERRIEALLTRRGLARGPARIAARYRATPPLPGRAGAIARRGAKLIWRAASGAETYAIALRPATGQTLAVATRRQTLVLPTAACRGRLTVVIVALDASGRTGRPVTARFIR